MTNVYPAEIEEMIAELAGYKRPTTITIVDELPRGATGKIRKGALRSTADDGPADRAGKG